MCGIVAVLRRRSRGEPVAVASILAELEESFENGLGGSLEGAALAKRLSTAADRLEKANEQLRSAAAVRGLVRDAAVCRRLGTLVTRLGEEVVELEGRLDEGRISIQQVGLESFNASLLRLKDGLWALGRDRLGAARDIEELSGRGAGDAALDGFAAIHTALSALDRLEVRGRDSAGLLVLVRGHDLDAEDPQVEALLEGRTGDPLYRGGSVRIAPESVSFVYKAAAEIGKLGDNGTALRRAIRADRLLALALAHDEAQVLVLGHTRWASVGLINEANAHPLDEHEIGDRPAGPPVVAVLNGDVDNYADLRATERLEIPEEITTDAKVIPVLVSRRLAAGLEPVEAFRETVSSFVGSVAIGALSPAAPERLLLALRGSGQALYVGLSQDGYVVASEPYGLVEETSTYLRLDGETPGNPENPSSSRGQIVALDWERAGSLEGLTRLAYDGTSLPLETADLEQAEITTRDVDRGDHPHFLRKEIFEAPGSFRKTLRGRIESAGGCLRVDLPAEALPDDVRRDLASGALRRVIFVGQGTAAVAGRGIAFVLDQQAAERLRVSATQGTELSGFGLEDDMTDTLVVAISQSGTTTDTNRTVDLVRARGARVISIVNRRHSDLVSKSDGVLYTSDGRDVEMSVASTKAFYAQIAAGMLLSLTIAEIVGEGMAGARRRSELLAALRRLPEGMEQVLAGSDAIAEIARRQAPSKRSWALVGNGANRTAAEEIRIKLSELCYKAIPCDVTEDKKHIDLSSEPLVVVCAAGLSGSTADDVAKEVGIYRAHKATPIVISSAGEQRYAAAVELIQVPRIHPAVDFVLATVAGHLFGYHAALAIDALAVPLRRIRASLLELEPDPLAGGDLLEQLSPRVTESAKAFFSRLREGAYDGQLEASTAVELATLLRYVDGSTPLVSYAAQRGRPGSPGVVVEDLAAVLTGAIDELTRPIDAIKHQAKTVTVGISRTDEALFTVPLVRELLATGVDRDHLGYGDLKGLAALDPVVDRVTGHTRYRIDGDPRDDDCAIHVVATGGISRDLPSRTGRHPILRGTKRQVALERRLLAARGRSDDRTVLLVPELAGDRVVGLTLLHVHYVSRASAAALRGVLSGYRGRYSVLRDAVTETEPTFREDLLEVLEVSNLLCDPVHVLAERWRAE